MKRFYSSLLWIISLTAACSQQPVPEPPTSIIPSFATTLEPQYTSIPSLTPSPTITETVIPPSITPEFTDQSISTPSSTAGPTRPPTYASEGARVQGSVVSPVGDPIEGIEIQYAFQSYPGSLLAVTNALGRYEGFILIPHEEVVRVWAVHSGFIFKPGAGDKSWLNGEFAWHHYGGFEDVHLDFIGTPR